jgi:hypothetical protein
LGVGCDETGVCYAAKHGLRKACGRPDTQPQAASSTQAGEIEDLAQSVERIASCRDGAGYNSDADCLRTAASMIRRLASSTTPASANGQFVPGVMCCAKCKFRLVRTNLYAANGTLGAGDNNTEPCPNGCGPLWPVTWEQEARECWALLENTVPAPPATRAPGVEWPAGVLNRDKTLEVLRSHNAWRRGAKAPQTDPRLLGLALDAAIAALTAAQEGAQGDRIICPNCDTALPEGCGGIFKAVDGPRCWLNRAQGERGGA